QSPWEGPVSARSTTSREPARAFWTAGTRTPTAALRRLAAPTPIPSRLTARSPAYVDKTVIAFTANFTNTGATTLNLSGLGAALWSVENRHTASWLGCERYMAA